MITERAHWRAMLPVIRHFVAGKKIRFRGLSASTPSFTLSGYTLEEEQGSQSASTIDLWKSRLPYIERFVAGEGDQLDFDKLPPPSTLSPNTETWIKHYREGRAIFTRDDLTVDVPVSILDELVKGR